MMGRLALIAVKCATGARSITSCTEPETSIKHPVCLAAITSWWSPKILKACAAKALALTWKTPGNSSPATLYILGIINKSP